MWCSARPTCDPPCGPLNRVALTNAFDITFDPDGGPVVTDASGNGIAGGDGSGRTRFLHRFGQLSDPQAPSVRIDAVPTGIARLDDEYLVTLTGGCPYPDGAGRLVAVDRDRNERVVASGLNMPIDVEVGPDGSVWVLEFARFESAASCFTGDGYQPGTGRLSRLDGDRLTTIVDGLDFPGAVVAGLDGSLLVSEVFAGRILRLAPELAAGADPDAESPAGAGAASDGGDTASSPARPWRLYDGSAEAGVDFVHGAFVDGLSADPVAMMGGGVCWLDADGDDDLDLYLVNSHAEAEADRWRDRGGLPTNRLLMNDGEGRFGPAPPDAGADVAVRGNGCLATDVDGDGDTDLYLTVDGPNSLLVNDGSGRFTDRADRAGVALDGWSSAAVAGDVDGDGTLDLFVGTYIDFERTVANPVGAFPQDFLGEPNLLFLGRGDGTFVDATDGSGLSGDLRTLGALLADFDRDGDLDLYVANDGQANILYENRSSPGRVAFVEVAGPKGAGDTGSGMGVAGGDYDRDGSDDLMVTNWRTELHAVYRGLPPERPGGEPGFVYSTNRLGFAGLGNGTTGWGTAWADLDNDADLDLLIANGDVPITDLGADAQPVQLLGNLAAEGSAGQLRDWAARSGLSAIDPKLGRGLAVADYDNDGDLDFVVNQIAGPALLVRNDDPPGRSLTVVTDPPTPGTIVEVELVDGMVLRRELTAGSSYLATGDPRLHVGLGAAPARLVRVIWPDGAESIIAGPIEGFVPADHPDR